MTDDEFSQAVRNAALPNGHTLAEYEFAAGRPDFYREPALAERNHQRATGRPATPTSVAEALAGDLARVLRDLDGALRGALRTFVEGRPGWPPFERQPPDLIQAAREARPEGPAGALVEVPGKILQFPIHPGQFWRHYKGGVYEIVTTARVEATGETVVVYRGETGAWTRPVLEFMGRVESDDYQGPRFTLVEAPQ